MGWNEPRNNNQNNDQPPDLDEALRKLQDKFKRVFSNGKETDTKDDTPPGGFLALMIAGVVFILWALSGIFIVGSAEQAAILRFGKYVETVGSGPHWIPRFIDSYYLVNTERVSDYSYSANMLTKDENLVSVAVAVQYRIGDLEHYLFNVASPEESLKQATSSALRQVVGNTTLDQLITEGREAWGTDVQESLTRILDGYKTGIYVVNVSPQPARAPENVQDAFDDAIKAQEDERRFIEQAKAYEARVVPIAVGRAKRITEEAEAYREQVVLRAKGETALFLGLLPQYKLAPVVTSERMYLDTLTQVFSNTTKILVDSKSGNLLYLPLDKLQANAAQSKDVAAMNPSLINSTPSTPSNGTLLETRDVLRPIVRPGRD